MNAWLIAGAGTDIGKTYVMASLCRSLRARGVTVRALKPVASGVPPLDAPEFANSDTAVLLNALGLPVTVDSVQACTPWRFAAPLSPDMAAAAEGRSLVLDEALAWCRDRIDEAEAGAVTLIEGVGGVMSPITEDALNLDLIKALRRPVILVGGTYLGALSHTLTALETLRTHGAGVDAIVLNETAGSTVDFDATCRTLARFAGRVPIVPLRYGEDIPATVLLGRL